MSEKTASITYRIQLNCLLMKIRTFSLTEYTILGGGERHEQDRTNQRSC
jgi:hypothetical protein